MVTGCSRRTARSQTPHFPARCWALIRLAAIRVCAVSFIQQITRQRVCVDRGHEAKMSSRDS